ncbi:MAG: type IV toxin-antitoxin system AbiEi family antitoxin domain-containing protein [Anaerolineaceae bacterium]|nr:type IV toxin-antitoxin system AbiEi family antitoxin domain-containing protein [Anaerolineaceae bacterium]
MSKSSQKTALDLFKDNHGWLRTKQALALGISPRTLYALKDAGLIIRENRGLYRLAD